MLLPKLRHKPKFPYAGLTIVLSNPSRFDIHELLSANAGYFFKSECLRPEVTYQSCDIRTSNTFDEGLLGSTKAILLLGHKAMLEWSDKKYNDYTLSEQRGHLLDNKWGLPIIASYFPQDAMDIKDYESEYNKLVNNPENKAQYILEDDDEDDGNIKRKGNTKRSNYKFWLRQDTKKILTFINPDTSIPLCDFYLEQKFEPVVYPTLERAIEVLRSNKNQNFFIDIETNIETRELSCVGFCFDESSIYVCPIFRYNNLHAYSNTGKLFASLAIAMRDNTTVCHNGFAFDLLVLASKYRIPFGRKHKDTMAMTHRCFPEIEKSLGHCGSLWTWERYHKDECIEPHNESEELSFWQYNAKDVFLTRLVHNRIIEYANRIPGLTESINQVNESIYAYTLNTLYGLSYKEEDVITVQKTYDRLLTQYLRMCRLLLGDNFLPSSNKDCVNYFHGKMNYPIIMRTKKGNSSLGKGSLYKLKLKYPENILIDICLKFREITKAAGSLKFNDWKLEWKSQNTSQEILPGTIEIK